MRLSSFWRLYLLCAAVLCAAALGAAWWASTSEESDRIRLARERLEAQTEGLLAPARALFAAPAGDAAAVEQLVQLAGVSGSRVTLVRADGRVLFDSEREARTLENHGSRPEVRGALTGGIGHARRISATSGKDSLYVARAVPGESGPTGVVRAAWSLEALPDSARRIALAIGGATLVALGATLLFAAALARRIRAPLAATADMAEAIARGDYRRAAAPHGAPEIRRLSEAIGTMTAQLEHRLEMMTVDRNKVLAILSSMVEGVVAVDQNERVVHINTVASKLLDADPASAVGRRIWEVSRVPAVQELLDRTRELGEPCSAECSLPADEQNPAGAVLELRAAPLRDGSGAVLVLHDVTALRKLENIRRDFVANVSHELKTPLTAIRALVETMIDDPEMPEPTLRRFLEKIRDQSARLTTLVADLLTLARIESGAVAPERRLLDARTIARECAARVGAACEKKSIALSVEIPAAPVLVHADDESLRQIVDNLLDNAAKYTPAGGSIWLVLQRREEWVELEVRDTGIGIDARDRERIFERFYRVDKARSRELGGTGLGLSIVKHLAQALGGQVSLQSQLGRGSTFGVRIPAAHSDAAAAPAS
jgi:two-component system phosphate regulon sensor histidine kinase PhoR